MDELFDIYSAEQQLTKALPKMAKAAESDELREAFELHLAETEEHVSRLDQVVKSLGESMKRKTCAAMKGLVEEAQELMMEQKGTPVIDAALIAPAQKLSITRSQATAPFAPGPGKWGMIRKQRF